MGTVGMKKIGNIYFFQFTKTISVINVYYLLSNSKLFVFNRERRKLEVKWVLNIQLIVIGIIIIMLKSKSLTLALKLTVS